MEIKIAGLPRLWTGVVACAAVWWFVGLNLFIYHIAAALLFLMLVQGLQDKKLFIGPSAFFLTLLSLVYFVSIMIRSAVDGGGRSLAAFYNLSFWVMGILLVIAMSNTYTDRFRTDLPKVLRFVAFTIALVFIGFMAYWATARHAIILETPLYKPLRGIDTAPLGLIENSLLVKPVFLDWFASFSTPRFNVYSPYATAAAAMLAIVLMITGCDTLAQGRFRPVYALLLVSTFAALVMTLSRAMLVFFLISVIILFLVKRKRFFVWALVALLIFAAAAPWVFKSLNFMLSLRQESNEGRLDIYRTSLGMLDGLDWFLGLGVKPREETILMPLGSQSTYLSLLFKTGIIGLVLFLGFQFTLLRRWFSLREKVMSDRKVFFFWCGLGGVFISMSLWFLTDDLDAPQLMSFLYFSIVGIFEGFDRQLRPTLPERG